MRQIILDTETTGLEPKEGHRIIEIGCIELVERQFTGNTLHHYINPEREVENDALAVHGISNEFLHNKPKFAAIVDELLHFIQDAELIAHNAPFDLAFLNHEIKLIKPEAQLLENYLSIVDTLPLARKMFPGQRNSLDALCKRYKIDLSSRKLHGALLDAQLLAEVYLLMTSGQSSLFANIETPRRERTAKSMSQPLTKKNRAPLPIIYANDAELAVHQASLTTIKAVAKTCLWEN